MAFKFNPLTGNLDLVNVPPPVFNASAIITHSNFSTGNHLQIYDPKSGAFVDLGDLIVTDEEGNVVVNEA
jgi:hypothetical protein